MAKEKVIVECEEVEQAPWWKSFAYIREGWKSRPFTVQIDWPFGFRNPFCNVFYRKPRTLREVGIERFLHRQVLGYENSLGSYGMGGPGFSGFSLSKTKDYHRECLVLTLWGAQNWILFDGEPICRDRRQEHLVKQHIESKGRTIYSGYDEDGKEIYTRPEQANEIKNAGNNINEFTSAIVGSELVSIELKQDYSGFEFLKDSRYHKLEAPGNPDKLVARDSMTCKVCGKKWDSSDALISCPESHHTASLEKRVWNTDEHIGDAWVVSRYANLQL